MVSERCGQDHVRYAVGIDEPGLQKAPVVDRMKLMAGDDAAIDRDRPGPSPERCIGHTVSDFEEDAPFCDQIGLVDVRLPEALGSDFEIESDV